MSRQDEQLPSFSEIQNKLRSGEDHDLARRLQEEEFKSHYARNRNLNGNLVTDRQTTREVQTLEDQMEREARLAANYPVVMSDEEFARRLQAEMDREENEARRRREEQLREDERLALQLSAGADLDDFDLLPPSPPPSSVSAADAQIPPTNPPPYPGPPLSSTASTSSSTRPPPSANLIDLDDDDHTVPQHPQQRPSAPGFNLTNLIDFGAAPSSQPPPIGFRLDVIQPTPVLQQHDVVEAQFSASNPFLVDLGPSVAHNSPAYENLCPNPKPPKPLPRTKTPPVGFFSEFGLPPPSNLALGQLQSNGNSLTHN